jgi:hypothetical protein
MNNNITVMNFIDGEPRDTDIAMGKGHGVGGHGGNKVFRKYIVANIPRYQTLSPRERSGLFKEMVATINRSHARFVALEKKSGRYFEVCDAVAHSKVGQVRCFSLCLNIFFSFRTFVEV